MNGEINKSIVFDTNKVLGFLKQFNGFVNLQDHLRQEIKEKTIEFRRVTKCKLPDSIIAATAIVLDAILATNDAVLLKKQFPGLCTIR
jgi:predicted nucleic acid-binding protein